MTQLSRRSIVAGSLITAAGVAGLAPARAQKAGGAATVPLEEALRLRRSTRRFGAREIPEAQLLRLLWAATGVNRQDSGERTAPAWRGAKDVDIYVAREAGVHRYDPAANALKEVLGKDIRGDSSPAAYIQRAPAVLIYVSDRERLVAAAGKEAAGDEQALAIGAHVNAAMMAQNVYLFAAAEGLSTVLIGGSADRKAIKAALSLPNAQSVVYIQPVGAPR